jgi:class 3 adenylate cyclase
METNMAILIADLSGYTALTETHGSVTAADLIDKYIGIARTCLVGDCKLHESVGDEIMIVSYSPDDLAATAVMILSNTSNEENFLQVHGGLHYGKVLQRANSYFGSTINLTSRIAAKANAGSLMCSDDFVNALSDKSGFALLPKGSHGFKNITGHKEIFELDISEKRSFYIDPVCRMVVLDTDLAISHPSEQDQYFCSADCLHIYTHRKKNEIN